MKKSTLFVLFAFVAAAFLGGCASERMMELKAPPEAVASPSADKATMVFFRSSFFGGAVQSSVFDISKTKPELIGILSAGKKIAHTVSQGQHRFMVIGESADFLDVNASAGKIYYARVSPRIGFWKARFAFEPVAASETGLTGELAECSWVANTKDSRQWAADNMVSIISKQAEYLPDWEKSTDRQSLKPEDGK